MSLKRRLARLEGPHQKRIVMKHPSVMSDEELHAEMERLGLFGRGTRPGPYDHLTDEELDELARASGIVYTYEP